MPLTPDPEIPDLVSLTEAADILGSGRIAAHKRATRGNLPGKLVGKTLVFRRAVVEAVAARDKARKEAAEERKRAKRERQQEPPAAR